MEFDRVHPKEAKWNPQVKPQKKRMAKKHMTTKPSGRHSENMSTPGAAVV